MAAKTIVVEPKTIYISLATIVSILLVLIPLAWKIGTCAIGVRDDIASIRLEVQQMNRENWKIDDQKEWAIQSRELNRDIDFHPPSVQAIVKNRN